jgi:hypothetical protein
LLAAQINYDSLFLLASAVLLLLTLYINKELTAYKRINSKYLIGFLVVGLLGSLIKFAFLPIFAAAGLYLLARIWHAYRSARKIALNIGFGLTLMTRSTRWLLLLALVVSIGLFGERYGLNVAHYHQPIPDCEIVLGVASSVAIGLTAKRLWRRYDHQFFVLFGLVSAFYIVSLWLQEYKAFLHTGHSVAINGRYLFVILPFVILVAAFAWNELLRRPRTKVYFMVLTIAVLAWGGGALTYVLRSNDGWYWPGSNPVKSVNHTAQNILEPITPGSNKPTQFLGSN